MSEGTNLNTFGMSRGPQKNEKKQKGLDLYICVEMKYSDALLLAKIRYEGRLDFRGAQYH